MVRPLLFSFVGGATSFVIVRILFSSEESTFAASFAAIIALLIIALLGYHYYRRPATDLRLAGDNLYYLGLLFTLSSLIMALLQLFVFQPEGDDLRQRTHDLIGNFGIALISTIAGILGRILLQSLSDEKAPARQEDDKTPTRQEDDVQVENVPPSVSDSVMALRRTLREATDAFSHFTRVTQNQAEQTKAHSEVLIRDFNEKMSTEAERGLSEVMMAWRESTKAIVATSNDLVKQFDKDLSEATGRAEAAWSSLAEEATRSSESTRLQLASDATEISTILEGLATTNRVLTPLVNTLVVAESRTKSLGETAGRVATTLDGRAAEIVNACNTFAQGATNLQQEGLAELKKAIASFTRDARDQLKQEGKKWSAVTAEITKSAETRLEKATIDAKAAGVLSETISNEAKRSLTVVIEIRDSLEKAVRAAEVLRNRSTRGRSRSRWTETTWNWVKHLGRKD